MICKCKDIKLNWIEQLKTILSQNGFTRVKNKQKVTTTKCTHMNSHDKNTTLYMNTGRSTIKIPNFLFDY